MGGAPHDLLHWLKALHAGRSTGWVKLCNLLVMLTYVFNIDGFYCIPQVLQTSGTSNGRGKCVLVPNGALVDNVKAISERLKVGPGDVVLLASPLLFDPSLIELFCGWSTGATVLMVSDEVKVNPARLLAALVDHRVSVVMGTTSLISRFGAASLSKTLLARGAACRALVLGVRRRPTRVAPRGALYAACSTGVAPRGS